MSSSASPPPPAAAPPPREEADPELVLLMARLGASGRSASRGGRRWLPWVLLLAVLATLGLRVLREKLAEHVRRAEPAVTTPDAPAPERGP